MYVEECTCQQKKKVKCQQKKKVKEVVIPKPERLIGETQVYQKEGIPYWFCKIKGRDEFMHLYTEDLSIDDLLYDSKTGIERNFSTFRQKHFKENVLEALKNKPKEGRWIPVFEPSSDGKGGLQFVKGEKPLVGLKVPEWCKMLEEYSPENESGIASKTTCFLLLLRWLKDGIATLE